MLQLILKMIPSLSLAKAALVVAAIAIPAFAVYGYNNAIKKAETLKQENIRLRAGVQDAMAELAAVQEQSRRTVELLRRQQDNQRVIHDTEIKTIEVIKEVQGECLDAPVPAAIIERLRD